MSPDTMNWEEGSTISVAEETWKKLKPRDILQSNWPVLFKNVKVMRDKERWKELFIWRRLRIPGNYVKYAILDWVLNLYGPTGIYVWRALWLDGNGGLLLLSPFGWLHCAYVGECPSTREIHTEVLRDHVHMSAAYFQMVQNWSQRIWVKDTLGAQGKTYM